MTDAEVQGFLAGFMHDFERLDWPRFRARFADESSVFYPPRFGVQDGCGRAVTDPSWATVFDAIRAHSSALEAPYMKISPQGLRLKVLGDCALVTFTLNGPPGHAHDRRTLVLHKDMDGVIRIVHLHGSTAA